MTKKIIISILKKIEILSAISVRATKLTGKSKIPLHPKHLIIYTVWFAKYLKKNDLVLDLGCNSGQLTFKIASKVRKVIGFEINEILVERAIQECTKKKINNIEFLKGDANKRLPFNNNIFNRVICSDVLEHLHNRDYALKEMKRVLRPGGTLFLVTDNPNTSWKKLQKSVGAFYYADPDHKYEYPLQEIVQKLNNLKFNIISIDIVTYDTPFKGLIDLIGGFSLSYYKKLGIWRKNMLKIHPEDTTGYKIVSLKK